MSIENVGEEEDKINFKAEAQDPEELRALIENSEDALPDLKGKARELMVEAIRVNKEKLSEMEGKNIETKETGEKKEFTAEEVEKIKKIVKSDKEYKLRFLRQVEDSDDENLKVEALRFYKEAEEVEEILNK